ncbi:glucosamine-6-phosphate deaminase [soil metagenome]
MEIIILPDAEVASQYAASLVARLIKQKPTAVLGLATGSTPLPFYEDLVRKHREEGLDLSQVTTFNLDEYVGLAPEHPASYHYFMRENFFSKVNIPGSQTNIPDGLGQDVPTTCQAYEADIAAAGGIDVQILGIGGDGHIGFNEPTSSLASRTRIKTLTQRTREDNAPFFANAADVPHHVITMGVGTIMEAKHVILLAFGAKKAQAVADTVEGPVTAMVPASVLQLHPQATVLLDEASGSKLTRGEYYRWVFGNKPSWQQV